MAHQTHEKSALIAALLLFFAAIAFASPAASAGADQTTTVGQNITVNGASSSCTACSITSYSWNFGDNGTASGVSATHSYSSSGSYTVTLTIVANSSEISSDTLTATVQSGDATAPTITHTNITAWTINASLPVSAVVTDNVGVSTVTLYYKGDGASGFTSTSMSASASTYSGTIPSSATNGTNVSYYISASDGSSNTANYPTGGSSSPLVALLSATDVVPPITTLISVSTDSSSPYWVTSNSSNNAQVLLTGESGMLCRMGQSNTNYSGMTVGYVDCTISSSTANCTESIQTNGNYTRYVACKDSTGNEQANTSTLTISFGVDSEGPSAVSAINSSELVGKIRLRWTPPTDSISGVSVQKVYRSAGCGATYSSIASLGASVSEYNDTTGTASTSYCYKIYGQDNAGVLASSSPTTSSIVFGAPAISAISLTLSGTLALSATTSENATCRYSASNVGYSSMSSEFTSGQNTTSHSVGVSGSSGTVSYYASCADTAGNAMSTANSSSYTFANTTTTQQSSSSGTGGGSVTGQATGSTPPAAPSTTTTSVTPSQPAPTAPPTQPAPEEKTATLITPASVSAGERVTITLVDSIGAPISGAKIVVTDPNGNKLEYVTDSNGQAKFVALVEGTYAYAAEGVQLASAAQTSATKTRTAPAVEDQQPTLPSAPAQQAAAPLLGGALFLVGAGTIALIVIVAAAYLLFIKKGGKKGL